MYCIIDKPSQIHVLTYTFGVLSICACVTSYSLMFFNNNNSRVLCFQVGSRISSIYVSFMQHKHSQTKAEIWFKGLFAVIISDHFEVISTLRFLCQNMSCQASRQ